jgi:FkbM family methyltransferase
LSVLIYKLAGMNDGSTIISTNGKLWQHNLLFKIIKTNDFPTRLRLFHIIKKLFKLELLSFKTPSGLQLLLDINDWVQSQIYYHGNYERDSVALFKKLSLQSSVIFDIGSHIGQYALECAVDDPLKDKKIFAIEVNPKTFALLLNNIQLNNFTQVKPILGAISSKKDLVNINIPAYWNMGNTQISETIDGLNNYYAASFSILDLVKQHNITAIDLVKLDIEGQEFDVLNDLMQAGIKPLNILFEHIPEAFSKSKQVIDLLLKEGYLLKDVAGNEYKDDVDLIDQNVWAQKKNDPTPRN